ncbi:hypothetical protein EVAR_58934_1 [Eumeta japonica]|uniref:Uncharacterized protein n=1 Tax=Eumeta variegata TaxID=151549 RepID=A0A4C1YBH7_EUMVA|nr:hypothetical protein EVAR_58934_1 [Eumeta japonica]
MTTPRKQYGRPTSARADDGVIPIAIPLLRRPAVGGAPAAARRGQEGCAAEAIHMAITPGCTRATRGAAPTGQAIALGAVIFIVLISGRQKHMPHLGLIMEPEGKHRNSIMKQRILAVFGLVQIVLRCTLTMNDFQGLMMQLEVWKLHRQTLNVNRGQNPFQRNSNKHKYG